MGKLGNFELSAEQRKIAQERNVRKLELRNLYWKKVTDPHQHATGEGGHLFDPAPLRFQSMRVSQHEYFKPNYKTFKYGFWMLVVPVVAFAQLLKWDRQTREKSYRDGEVSYRDRYNKFI